MNRVMDKIHTDRQLISVTVYGFTHPKPSGCARNGSNPGRICHFLLAKGMWQ